MALEVGILTWNTNSKMYLWTKNTVRSLERLTGYLTRIPDSGHRGRLFPAHHNMGGSAARPGGTGLSLEKADNHEEGARVRELAADIGDRRERPECGIEASSADVPAGPRG